MRENAVLLATVRAVTIDDHRRRDDELPELCAPLQHGFEQRCRADRVDVDVATDLDHGLAVTDHSTLVIHDVDIGEGPVDRLPIPQIGANELRVGGQESGLTARVGLLDEAVEHPDFVASCEQCVDQMRTDEARSSRYKHALGQGSSISFADRHTILRDRQAERSIPTPHVSRT